MKKVGILISLLLISWFGLSQGVLDLYPTIYPLAFSPEGEQAHNTIIQKCKLLNNKMGDYDLSKLTKEEQIYWSGTCKEERKDEYWRTKGNECSWYCGGTVTEITASSYLAPQGKVNYNPNNAHDFYYNNAWAEGVDGYGVGEYLVYSFDPRNPRITHIIVANGYVKSQADWENNSRVKKLKVYLNNEPYAILNLADMRSEQSFEVEPIGNAPSTWSTPPTLPMWTLKFEILEVYPGKKYDDTVISEIHFDGIDVH